MFYRTGETPQIGDIVARTGPHVRLGTVAALLPEEARVVVEWRRAKRRAKFTTLKAWSLNYEGTPRLATSLIKAGSQP